MKTFNIGIISKAPKKIFKILSHIGEITLDDYKETFIMPLDYWSARKYQQQWKDGLERLKTHDISCIVTTIKNLQINPWVEMWTLYKEGKKLFVRNTLLIPKTTPVHAPPLSSFNADNCYKFIRKRKKYIKRRPVEWNVPFNRNIFKIAKLLPKYVEGLDTKDTRKRKLEEPKGQLVFRKDNIYIIPYKSEFGSGYWIRFSEKYRTGILNKNLQKKDK